MVTYSEQISDLKILIDRAVQRIEYLEDRAHDSDYSGGTDRETKLTQRILELETALATVRGDRNKVIEINKSLVTQRDRNHAELSRAQTALEVSRFDKEINDKALCATKEELQTLKGDLIDAKSTLLNTRKAMRALADSVANMMLGQGLQDKFPFIFEEARRILKS